MLPICIVFAVKGIALQSLESEMQRNHIQPHLYKVPSLFWADACDVFSPKSIEDYLEGPELNPLVSIESFLSQQGCCIMDVKNKEDSTMQLLYRVSKKKVETQLKPEEDKTLIIEGLCVRSKTQFEKVA